MDIFYDIKTSESKVIKVIIPNIKAVGPVHFDNLKKLYIFRIDELYLAYKGEAEAEKNYQSLLISINEWFTGLIKGKELIYEQTVIHNVPESKPVKNKRKYSKKKKTITLNKKKADPAEDLKEDKEDIEISSPEYRAYMKGYSMSTI